MINSDSDWNAILAPQLAIAVAVLEEEHITRAAQRLGVPQPTVSATMRRLADEIGTPLIQASGRGVVATAAGRALLPAAREALAALRAAHGDIQEVVDPDRGKVAVGFLLNLGVNDVPRLLGAFLGAHPHVRFTLSQAPAAKLVDRLSRGELDVVVLVPLPESHDGFESIVLRDECLYLCVPAGHRYAARQSIDLSETADETYMALAAGHGLREAFDQMCSDGGFIPHLAFESEDVATLRSLVRAGLGVAVLPRADPATEAGVVTVPIDQPAARATVGAMWPTTHRLPPAARRFVTFLSESGAQALRE